MEVTTRTIQLWHKQGLKVIDENTMPYLVMGADLKNFLKKMMDSRRVKLRPGEFYCLSCHKAVQGEEGTIKKIKTGKVLGLNANQVILQGKCEFCGSEVNRYSSDRVEEKIKKERKKDENKHEIKEAKQGFDGEQLLLPYLR